MNARMTWQEMTLLSSATTGREPTAAPRAQVGTRDTGTANGVGRARSTTVGAIGLVLSLPRRKSIFEEFYRLSDSQLQAIGLTRAMLGRVFEPDYDTVFAEARGRARRLVAERKAAESGNGLGKTLKDAGAAIMAAMSLPARRRTFNELNAMSDRDLSDLGIARADIPRVFDEDYAGPLVKDLPESGTTVPASRRPGLAARALGAVAGFFALPRRQTVFEELNALSDANLAKVGVTRAELAQADAPGLAAKLAAAQARARTLLAADPTAQGRLIAA